MRAHLLTGLALGVVLVAEAPAAVEVGDGWAAATVDLPGPPGGASTLDRLPNGNLAVFDGTALVEVSPTTGLVAQTLFTPPGFVFASFSVVDPTGSYVLFGESSNHAIWKIPLSGARATIVTTIEWNYACTFMGTDAAIITYADASFTKTFVARLDVTTGALDTLAEIPGPSGPVAFDTAGDLYYGMNSPTYPAPTGQQSVLRFSAAQVQGAIGPTFLTDSVGVEFATGLTAPTAFTFDEEGDLFVSDSIAARLVEFDPSGAEKSQVALETNGVVPSIGALVFAGNGLGAPQFSAYQREDAGTLYAASTDFATFSHLNRITPARPLASVNPPGPIAPGPFTFDIEGGPADGNGFVFVAGAPLATELGVVADDTVFMIGFDPSSLITILPISLGNDGALSIPTTHVGGAGGASIVVQLALWGPAVGATGTTNALTLAFQ